MITLKVSTLDHHSLSLSWEPEEPETPITGYIISYKSHLDNWEEVKVSGKRNKYVLDNLRCGTKYQMTAVALNKVGRSKASPVLSAATAGNGMSQLKCRCSAMHDSDLLLISVPVICFVTMTRDLSSNEADKRVNGCSVWKRMQSLCTSNSFLSEE